MIFIFKLKINIGDIEMKYTNSFKFDEISFFLIINKDWSNAWKLIKVDSS